MIIDHNPAFEVTVEAVKRFRNVVVDHNYTFPPDSTQFAAIGLDTIVKYEVGDDVERLYEVISIYWVNYALHNTDPNKTLVLSNKYADMYEERKDDEVFILALTIAEVAK